MSSPLSHSSKLSSNVLFFLGLVDLIRGLFHTFFIHQANDIFAHMDLSTNGQDLLTLLSAFGISNFLTGFIFILISRKAQHLSTYILALILLSYLLGIIGMYFAGVTPQSDFLGRFFMFAYLGVCAVTVAWAYWRSKRITQ